MSLLIASCPIPSRCVKRILYLKSAVEAGDVDEDEGDDGLEDDGEVQHPVVHATLKDGQTARSRHF